MEEEEDYVSFEVATLLKDKGCNYISEYSFLIKDLDEFFTVGKSLKTRDFMMFFGIPEKFLLSRPALWDAAKWLREKHKKHVSVNMDRNERFTAYVETQKAIMNVPCRAIEGCGTFDSYEQALNEGILEALKLI